MSRPPSSPVGGLDMSFGGNPPSLITPSLLPEGFPFLHTGGSLGHSGTLGEAGSADDGHRALKREHQVGERVASTRRSPQGVNPVNFVNPARQG